MPAVATRPHTIQTPTHSRPTFGHPYASKACCISAVSTTQQSPGGPTSFRRSSVPGMLAAYPTMMRRDRHRLGLRECRAAWLLGLIVRQYRQLEAGEEGALNADVWERMVEVFG